jgi:hypothetical protein
MPWSNVSPTVGTQPYADFFVSSTVQAHPLGLTVTATDNFWGTGKFVYLKSNAAVLKGSLVIWDEIYQAVLLPNTALQGFSFAVAMCPAASGNFFWAQTEGRCVYQCINTVAADAAVAIAAAGQGGTSAISKQLLGFRQRISATGTKVITSVNTVNGSGVLLATNGYDGFFNGMAVTGTGIPSSSVVAAMDPDGKRFTIGSAIATFDKTCTATGSVSVTGTYTGFSSAMINNPMAQGAIT